MKVIYHHSTKKRLELHLFRLYYNDLEIRHVREELKQREEAVAAEHEQRQLIEEEMKEKRRELGKINRDQSSLEQEIKKCVCCFHVHILTD
ncbi:unnamed protein product [Trichobilharzia regenti]|nr:unnamed protein product [Trichobilharzia regenti]